MSASSVQTPVFRPSAALASPETFLAHAGMSSTPARRSSNAHGATTISTTQRLESESTIAYGLPSATSPDSAVKAHDEKQDFSNSVGVSLLTAPNALDQKNPARGLKDSLWATADATPHLPSKSIAQVHNAIAEPAGRKPNAFDKQTVRVSMKENSRMPFGRPRPGAVQLIKLNNTIASIHVTQEGQLRVSEALSKGARLSIEGAGSQLVYKPATSAAYWRLEFGMSHLASYFRSNCLSFLKPSQEGDIPTPHARQTASDIPDEVAIERTIPEVEAGHHVPEASNIDTTITTKSLDGKLISLSEHEVEEEEEEDDDDDDEKVEYVTAETLKDLEGISVLVTQESAAQVFEAMDKQYSGGFAGRLDEVIRNQWIKDASLEKDAADRVLGYGLADSIFAKQSDREKLGGGIVAEVWAKEAAEQKIITDYYSQASLFKLLNEDEQHELAQKTLRLAPAKYRQRPKVEQPTETHTVQAHSSQSAPDVVKYTVDELKHVRPNAKVLSEPLLSDEFLKNKKPQQKSATARLSYALDKKSSGLPPTITTTPKVPAIAQHQFGDGVGERSTWKPSPKVAGRTGSVATELKDSATTSTSMFPDVSSVNLRNRPLVRATDIFKQSKILAAMSSTTPKPRAKISNAHRRVSSSETSTSAEDPHTHSVTSSATIKPTPTSTSHDSEGFRRHRPTGSELNRLSKSFQDLTLASDSEPSANLSKSKKVATGSITPSKSVAHPASTFTSGLAEAVAQSDNRDLKGLRGLHTSMWATAADSIEPTRAVRGKKESSRSSHSTNSRSLNPADPAAPAWSTTNNAAGTHSAPSGMAPLILGHPVATIIATNSAGSSCLVTGPMVHAGFVQARPFPGRAPESVGDGTHNDYGQKDQHKPFHSTSPRPPLSPSKKENVAPTQHGRLSRTTGRKA